jgi:hypothetical protein
VGTVQVAAVVAMPPVAVADTHREVIGNREDVASNVSTTRVDVNAVKLKK